MYYFLRQGTVGRNRDKLARLQEQYGSRYHFYFSWMLCPCAQLLPGIQVDENEALSIGKAYLVEDGQFRSDSYPASYLKFIDSKRRHLFTVRGVVENSHPELLILKVKKHFLKKWEWQISRRIDIGSTGA